MIRTWSIANHLRRSFRAIVLLLVALLFAAGCSGESTDDQSEETAMDAHLDTATDSSGGMDTAPPMDVADDGAGTDKLDGGMDADSASDTATDTAFDATDATMMSDADGTAVDAAGDGGLGDGASLDGGTSDGGISDAGTSDGTSLTDADDVGGTDDATASDTVAPDVAPDTAPDVAVDTLPDDVSMAMCPAPNYNNCGIGTPTIVWAKDPSTGTCCQYGRECYAPSGWTTYTSQQACQSA